MDIISRASHKRFKEAKYMTNHRNLQHINNESKPSLDAQCQIKSHKFLQTYHRNLLFRHTAGKADHPHK